LTSSGSNTKSDVGFDNDHSHVQYVVKYVEKSVQIAPEFLSDEEFKFYTGISCAVFKDICTAFGEKIKLDLEELGHNEQLLLFLMKLRLNLQFDDLAIRFDVSKKSAVKAFDFWLNKAPGFFGEIVCWLPNEKIVSTMPDSLKARFPDTTCIISTTEISIQRAKNLKEKHNNVKFLVAISPLGHYMFVSPAYEVRASDKYVVSSSGFLERLQPGMEVMAHSGYSTVSAEISATGATLNVPVFASGKQQLTLSEILKSGKDDAVCVHVERAFARLKKFRILNDEFPLNDVTNIEKIIVCCAGLCNLQPTLGKKKTVLKKCAKK
jgi:hypothetical protein